MSVETLETYIRSKKYDEFAAALAPLQTLSEPISRLLFVAIDCKDPRFVEELVECGADTSLTNKDGLTPLDYSRTFPRDEIMLEIEDILYFVQAVPWAIRNKLGQYVLRGNIIPM
jgi:ankyrin repeat protein